MYVFIAGKMNTRLVYGNETRASHAYKHQCTPSHPFLMFHYTICTLFLYLLSSKAIKDNSKCMKQNVFNECNVYGRSTESRFDFCMAWNGIYENKNDWSCRAVRSGVGAVSGKKSVCGVEINELDKAQSRLKSFNIGIHMYPQHHY